MAEWIDARKVMPPADKWVLCMGIDGEMKVLKYDEAFKNWDTNVGNKCYGGAYVTHWQHLPTPPKGE